ncbi:hypothetical protein BTVI_38051 [Pitangus sulphuratus]|nr:hypothetical protein BTVI_38051 [Pitangus sulphuratus]
MGGDRRLTPNRNPGTGERQVPKSMVQHFQGKGKDENKIPDTMVNQDMAKSKEQTKTLEVTPIQKRKYKTKLVCPVDDVGEATPSQVASPEPEIITESLWYNKLWRYGQTFFAARMSPF